MSIAHSSLPAGGFLRWLGLGPTRSDPAARPAATSAPTDIQPSPRERRRRQLIEDIGSFLVHHGLEVSPWTLSTAHEIITGSNPRLGNLVEKQVQARRPVTLDWLEDAARRCGHGDGGVDMSAMMGKLETVIDEFAHTATAAKAATSEYNSALEASVTDLRHASEAGVVLSQLAELARDMLARTRQIEVQLERSEVETRTLQQCLADARREAEVDHLTGLPNRRAFETVFDTEIALARTSGEPLCIAFCDVDRFKKINDTHGHEAGDRVLRVIAQTLSRISEDRCHVARHGGEEFAVLLRGRTLDEAWTLLDEAREGLATRRLVNRATDLPFGQITFSAGLAQVRADETAREALKAADEALYAAKESGRNQILRAETREPDPARCRDDCR